MLRFKFNELYFLINSHSNGIEAKLKTSLTKQFRQHRVNKKKHIPVLKI